MGSTGRFPSNLVSSLEQLKTEAADATNTDRLLTEPLAEEGVRLMANHAISPESSHPPVRLIRDETPSHYDAGQRSPEPFWFVQTPRIVVYLARKLRDSDITQVYCILAEQATVNGTCWRTHADIADDAGISERKARTILSILVEAGVITGERGRFCNGYTLKTRIELPTETGIDSYVTERQAAENVRSGGRKRPVSNASHSANNDRSTGRSVPVTRQETSTPPAGNDPQLKTRDVKTNKTRSPNGDTHSAKSADSPKREPTRIYQVAEWYANRIGGVIPGKGAREWADAKRLAETGITDDELPELFDWLAEQSWVKSLSMGLMASKFNEWRSAKVLVRPLPYNHHKSGKLVF